jgi:hypothetical protein
MLLRVLARCRLHQHILRDVIRLRHIYDRLVSINTSDSDVRNVGVESGPSIFAPMKVVQHVQ